MTETTLDDLADDKERRAQMVPQLTTYKPQTGYRTWESPDRHEPFEPTNMTGEDLQLVDAELSLLFGNAWCHVQVPNPSWNQFYLHEMHYTVGEWVQARDSNWLDGPPWLKVALAKHVMPDGGTNPYAFLIEDEEVQILESDPDVLLRRVKTP